MNKLAALCVTALMLSCHSPAVQVDRGIEYEAQGNTRTPPPTVLVEAPSAIPPRPVEAGPRVDLCCDDFAALCFRASRAECTAHTSHTEHCSEDGIRAVSDLAVVCVD